MTDRNLLLVVLELLGEAGADDKLKKNFLSNLLRMSR